MTAHALGWVGLLFVGVKAVIMRGQPSVVPRLALLLTSGAFSVLHMVCAEGMERVLQIRAKYPAAPQVQPPAKFCSMHHVFQARSTYSTHAEHIPRMQYVFHGRSLHRGPHCKE